MKKAANGSKQHAERLDAQATETMEDILPLQTTLDEATKK